MSTCTTKPGVEGERKVETVTLHKDQRTSNSAWWGIKWSGEAVCGRTTLRPEVSRSSWVGGYSL